MFAVAAYVLPRDTTSPRWNSVNQKIFSFVRPYILFTSQWQKWDIFSPDPLRRASFYTIDVFDNNEWRAQKTLDAWHLAWRTRAKEIKILERLEDSWNHLVPYYLKWECKELPDAGGKPLRLIAKSSVIPKTLDELRTFSSRTPAFSQRVLGIVQCPPTP